MQEAVQKVDRCRNVLNRKRQRSEPAAAAAAGAEKPSGSGALRIGAQNSNSSAVMSKRVRSSLADGRVRALSPLLASPSLFNSTIH